MVEIKLEKPREEWEEGTVLVFTVSDKCPTCNHERFKFSFWNRVRKAASAQELLEVLENMEVTLKGHMAGQDIRGE